MSADPRFQVRQMFERKIDGLDEFKLPDLTDEILTEVKADEALLTAFVDQEVRRMVYVVGQELLSQWRRAKERDGEEVIEAGASLMTRRALQRKAFARRLDWLRHYEQAGDRQVRLMAMTRQDCLLAAETRTKRIETESQYVRFLRTVAKNMELGERVEDRYKPEQLQKLFDACDARRKPKAQPASKTA